MSPTQYLTDAVHRLWRDKGALSSALLPLSWMTGWVVRRRAAHARRHPERRATTSLPVVVVGNIIVGGTGKTPVVVSLVQALQQRGWKPGVISRGYGVELGNEPRCGQGALSASEVGDEPALIAQQTGAPIAVHPSRALALRFLQREFPCVDVVVSDDGLQHLQLARDLEIIVQDRRGVGNGRLLPAGPLREPASRLLACDVIVTNVQAGDPVPPVASDRPERVNMWLEPVRVEHLTSGQEISWSQWLERHGAAEIGAVAAIGRPERFFAMLRHSGAVLKDTLALPDHDPYRTSPFVGMQAENILVTPKDAVKCRGFGDTRLWVVHAEPRFSDPAWLDRMAQSLHDVALRKRHPGPSTESLGGGSGTH